ncbi:MAG: segregation/condensation protein A [Candidatus Pacearchaeota archaeon]|nr:segregation/condensation protein A [Candidatus Pacearchaeota archaeon]
MQEVQNEAAKLGQSEVFELLTNNEVGWQAIIYDLINTEQLDPWDIDLGLLANKYLERIKLLEEANFFISSKVLLAASILLRLKSEILLDTYIKSIDEILFGKKEKSKPIERLELDPNDLPLLYPKTPLPRYRRVSLQELMSALDQAITTENRRIKKETDKVVREKATEIVLPRSRINIKDRIRNIYAKILTGFKKRQARIPYSELANNKEERIACFLPCLHLENQQKLFLEQENHFEEIYIWLYSHYQKQVEQGLIKPRQDVEKEEIIADETGFANPLADFFNLS